LDRFADWIRARNVRDVISDEPATELHAGVTEAGDERRLRGVPVIGGGSGAVRVEIGRMTVSSRPDHAIERLA
jgi:hypothetical protein